MLTADYSSFRIELRRLQRGLNRHLTLVFFGCWLACFLFWLAGFSLLESLLGRFWPGMRYIGSLGILIFAAVLLWDAWRRLTRRYSEEAAAAMLGRAFPGCGDNLINAVQLARRGQSQIYLTSVLSESPLLHREIHISQLYSRRYRQLCIRLLLGACCVCGGGMLAVPARMKAGLQHMFLPWQDSRSYTGTVIVSVSPGNAALKRGEKVMFGCMVEGNLPEEAYIQFENYKNQKIILHSRKNGAFQSEAPCWGEAGRYRAVAGDGVSPWYELRLVSPPALLQWTVSVLPPAVTGRKHFVLDDRQKECGVPVDSRLHFHGRTTEKLRKAVCMQGQTMLAEAVVEDSDEFTLDCVVRKQGELTLVLRGETEGRARLPLVVIPDRMPVIALRETPLQQETVPGGRVPVHFRAEDDYGVLRVGLERVMPRGRPEQVVSAEPEKSADRRRFDGRFVVDTGSFQCRPGEVLRVRCWAEDAADVSRRSYTPVIELRFPVENSEENQEKNIKAVKSSFEELVQKQRRARSYADRCSSRALAGGQAVQSREIQELLQQQSGIRRQAEELLRNREALGGLADQLAGLVNLEMVQILRHLEHCFRLDEVKRLQDWRAVMVLQTRIIAVLTGVTEGIDQEKLLQNKQDFFAMIQRIIQDQRKILKETRSIQAGQAVVLSALVHNQELLAESLQFFQDRCLSEHGRRSGDDFAVQLKKAAGMLVRAEIYEQMLCAAEHLESRKWPAAVQQEEKILRGLMRVMNLLNQWRMNQAKKILEKAGETLAKTAESLSELEKKQARIAEVTRDLKNRGKLDDEVREKLASMDQEQLEMADEVEKLANDLYQFPELPVCGELNSRMREIFEDVQQAADSENTPAVEIAVQKEDCLLDVIRSTKKRIEDVEMWLPDIPDNIVWNMESFDTDEFPDIPLVPLPDELEDIVGELLEQESSIDAQSQDTTGNNIVADMEMGWSVMDGPMPSFSAKGKSGNTRPNDNEMTGRSGSGREGQASGELVENHVKGYEGRKTHARRTMDHFQKGMVTEDENSTADARATGGGKLGGESETQGMFGAAPRRDLHTAAHGRNPQKLRQETEALYATARLLYLGTGSLGAAAQDMRYLEQAPPQIRELGGIRRRVMRQLSDSQVEMRDGVVLPMPVTGVSTGGGVTEQESSYDRVSGEYRELLKDYYRSLE